MRISEKVSSQRSVVSSPWPVVSSNSSALLTTDHGLLTTHHAPRTTRQVTRHPSPVTRHSPYAFTLVEILIALGIFSLVLVSIYSTWTAILRAAKVGNEAAAAVQRARMTGRMFRESLVSAQSFAINGQAHPEYYSFLFENGDRAYLEFTAHLSASFPRSGKFHPDPDDPFTILDVRRVAFSLEPSSDNTGRQLVLRQRPLLMNWDDSSPMMKDEREHPLVLAKNVRELKIEAWDPKKNNDLEPWVDSWNDNQTNMIPPKVRVTLMLGDSIHPNIIRDTNITIVRLPGFPNTTVQPVWQMSGPIGGARPPIQNPPPPQGHP